MTPLERAEVFAIKFCRTANSYALSYGGPVYLVGSMLTSMDPGDVDIRCLITREDAELWFGDDTEGIPDWTPARLALFREQLKQSRRLTRTWCRSTRQWPRIDFQFQIALIGESGEPIQDERPRIRIDRVPNSMLHAGMGDP